MYRRKQLKINIFYDETGKDILEVLKLDFIYFFNDYIRKNFL